VVIVQFFQQSLRLVVEVVVLILEMVYLVDQAEVVVILILVEEQVIHLQLVLLKEKMEVTQQLLLPLQAEVVVQVLLGAILQDLQVEEMEEMELQQKLQPHRLQEQAAVVVA
jgi:hypothetical protein